MSGRTDFQAEILAIAKRVLAERDSDRTVDPLRIEWAEWVLRNNAPAPARATEPPAARAFSEAVR